MAGQRFGLTNIVCQPPGEPWLTTGLAQPEQPANGHARLGWQWLANDLVPIQLKKMYFFGFSNVVCVFCPYLQRYIAKIKKCKANV